MPKTTLKRKTPIKNIDSQPIEIQQKQSPRQSLFISTSRLNRGQRKYCNCLMQVRTQRKKKPYAICKNMSYKIMLAKKDQSGFRFNPRNTNCIMNYDYSKYSLQDIQALAQERGIPLNNPKTGNPNNKNTLVQLLTKRYVDYHQRTHNAKHET